MIALADCNNFYASCERVFNPKLKNKPVFSVQYHPEANPGPQDSKYLFEKFINNIVKRKKYA